uniref:Uncharacterized protein n=1 Tax=Mustela putorius furo TaxID=9669 RepID=M3YPQ3_MUSPF
AGGEGGRRPGHLGTSAPRNWERGGGRNAGDKEVRVALLTRTGSARAGATRRPGTSLASAQHSWPSGPDPAFRADRSPLQKFVPPRQRKNTRTRSAHADFVSSLPPVKLESPAPLMAEAGGADGRCPSGPCDSRFSLAPAPAARFTGRAGALGSGDSRFGGSDGIQSEFVAASGDNKKNRP